MAVVRKIGKLSSKLLAKNTPLIYIVRGNKDYLDYLETYKPSAYKKYMPGRYPETEEERRKSAEKYGMHPTEYKPYPDDYRSTGDYPDLPWISVAAKDPYYPWDFPNLRRNFEDPVHQEIDMMTEDRYDYGVRELVDDYTGSFIFIATLAVFVLIHYLCPYTRMPRMEKQFPRNGVHYTFDPVE